jgi:hypothetical protein
MNAGRESLPGGDPFEQPPQLRALGFTESRAHYFFMRQRGAADRGQDFASSFTQLQSVDATVGSIGPAGYEPALLEGIDHRHEATGVHAELSRKFLLAETGRESEQAQDPRVRRR